MLRLVLALAGAFALLAPAVAGGAAAPELRVRGPAAVPQGAAFTVDVELENAGDADGLGWFVDVVVPTTGPDGRADGERDGIELASAGFVNTISRGSSFTFDGLGRALHPLLSRGGSPEVVEGRPGNLLWVAFDQLNQSAPVGAVNRLEAELVMGKEARPGRPLRIRVRGGLLGSSPAGGPPVVTGWKTVSVTPTAATLDEVARSLASDLLYVSPAADPGLSVGERAILERELRDATTPVYVAVLPESAGAPEGVLEQLVRLSGLGGTFAVAVGDRLRAASTELPEEDVDRVLAEAQEGADGPADALRSFVRGLEQAAAEAPADGGAGEQQPATTAAGGAAPEAQGGGSAAGWIVGPAISAALAALVALLVVRSRLRRRRERRRLLARVREDVDGALQALGEEIAALDLDVEIPGVPREAKDAYAEAVAAYDLATDELPHVREEPELRRIGDLAASGLGAIARTRGALERERPTPGSAGNRDRPANGHP